MLYETTSIAGVPVRLIDTAGIRETTDMVESIGIERSRSAIADADISLLVLDASERVVEDDLRLLGQVPAERRIVALNKIDLPRAVWPEDVRGAQAGDVISISAATGSGFDELTRGIFGRLAGDDRLERDDVMITDARQHSALKRAIAELGGARELMLEGELEEVILIKLHGALVALGEITGETLTNDILGQIFSTFCIGK
jgi:tRNA modification GTPase